MFGLLNDAEMKDSLDPEQYEQRRGRFYLIWNASKISGRPMLVALMAGHAAHEAETTDTETLLAEINGRFEKVFPSKKVPKPLEVIVTRWKRDRFTRGTYSYVGPETQPGDYNLMAQPIGNLFFAGEATCGTHPATVHGAFLSGLRVAAEVMDAMAGPISLPMPLVGPAPVKQELQSQYSIQSAPALPTQPFASWGSLDMSLQQPAVQASEPIIKQESDNITLASVPPLPAAPMLVPMPLPKKLAGPPSQSVCSTDPTFWVRPSFDCDDLNYEAAIIGRVLSQLGDRPVKPARPGVNPFLLFTKDKWDECREFCSKDATIVAKDAIRTTLGKWWKAATEEMKAPYLLQSTQAQVEADKARREWDSKTATWDNEAQRIREEYHREHPRPIHAGPSLPKIGMGVENIGVSKRKTNTSNMVVLDSA